MALVDPFDGVAVPRELVAEFLPCSPAANTR